MFTQLVALVAAAAVVRGIPGPETPDGVQKVGGDCTITWTPDNTGVWKKMHIELMAGSNLAMQHLTTVTTVDGTDASNTSFTWPCPGVSPNAAIYFYQFTSPFAPLSDTTWTTRFAIADASGNTVSPPNATQPSGQTIPWGDAELTDPSSAIPAPTDAGTQVSGSASSGASGTTGASGSVAPSGATGASGSSGASSTPGGASVSNSAPAVSPTASAGGVSGTSLPSSGGASTNVPAGGAGSKSANGSSTGSSSAGATASTNGAIGVRGAPLYALGAVAAFIVYVL